MHGWCAMNFLNFNLVYKMQFSQKVRGKKTIADACKNHNTQWRINCVSYNEKLQTKENHFTLKIENETRDIAFMKKTSNNKKKIG